MRFVQEAEFACSYSDRSERLAADNANESYWFE
jgi:hypothetical protein